MFQIGDIIEGTEESNIEYAITCKNQDFIGKVVSVNEVNILVEIVNSKDIFEIGSRYRVHSKYFQLTKNNITTIKRINELGAI